ncbi:C-type lectin domain family 12 member B-like [Cyclopterus lumpus]|uniref:C-type lectin domain family 12 member B-like n=1 Tax=Cyclopterus lumpus TaxID=8103 RepID=UPI001486B6FE|nr:C-type lectin domain family 12 member B-like [Cyclopterus lumpus]
MEVLILKKEIQEEADYVNEPVRPVYKVAAPPDQRFLFFSQTLPPIAVCWLILVLILGLRIHFTNVLSVNEAKLTAEIQQLKTLTRRLNASEDVSTPPAAIRNRTDRSAGDQEPETNVSRAQWSVDAYCPGSNGRRCQPCQRGWHFFQSGCYAMLYPDPPGWKTWEEAREDCRGKNSDLVSMDNAAEKELHRSLQQFRDQGTLDRPEGRRREMEVGRRK